MTTETDPSSAVNDLHDGIMPVPFPIRVKESLGRRWSPVQIRPPRPYVSSSYGRMIGTIGAAGVASLLLVACGSGPVAGPSPAADAPSPAAVMAPASPRPLPAGLDPARVRELVFLDAAGTPKRWEGGAFRHCFEPSIPAAARPMLEDVAARMSDLARVPRAAAGQCNVTWKVAADPYVEVPVGSANANLGNEASITRAVITFRFGDFVTGNALHEAGHVLGLLHTQRPGDLMYHGTGTRGPDFSADELAVLAWIYPSTR